MTSRSFMPSCLRKASIAPSSASSFVSALRSPSAEGIAEAAATAASSRASCSSRNSPRVRMAASDDAAAAAARLACSAARLASWAAAVSRSGAVAGAMMVAAERLGPRVRAGGVRRGRGGDLQGRGSGGELLLQVREPQQVGGEVLQLLHGLLPSLFHSPNLRGFLEELPALGGRAHDDVLD